MKLLNNLKQYYKDLPKSRKAIVLIFSIFLGIFFQIQFGSIDYEGFRLKNGVEPNEVTYTMFYEQNEQGNYVTEYGEGRYMISTPDEKFSGILVSFAEPVTVDLYIDIFFDLVTEEGSERDVETIIFPVGEQYFYQPIPLDYYDAVMVQTRLMSADMLYGESEITYGYIGTRRMFSSEIEPTNFYEKYLDNIYKGLENYNTVILQDIQVTPDVWTEQQQFLSRFQPILAVFYVVFVYLVVLVLIQQEYRRYWSYVIFTLGVVYHYIKLPLGGNDLIMFYFPSQEYSLFELLSLRYDLISSSLLLDTALYYLVQSKLIWAILCGCLFTLLCYSSSKLVQFSKGTCHTFAVLLFTCIPLTYWQELGPMYTTTYYLLPVSLGVYSLMWLKQWVDQEPAKKYIFVTTLVALTFAGNQEQTLVVMTLIYAVTIFLKRKEKLSLKPLYWHMLSIIINWVLYLASTGTKLRVTNPYLPQYEGASLFTKLDIVYHTTLATVFTHNAYGFVIFAGMIILYGLWIGKYKPVLLALPSFVACATYTWGLAYLENTVEFLQFLTYFYTAGLNGQGILEVSMIPFVCLTFLWGSMCAGLYLIIDDKKMKYLSLFVLHAGLISRFILIFMVPVWASGMRTYTLLFYSIFLVSLMLFKEISQLESKQIEKSVLLFTVMFALMQVSSYYLV